MASGNADHAMGCEETMIVAGVGFRRSASAREIADLVRAALSRAGLARADRLATIPALAESGCFAQAAQALGVEHVSAEESALVEAAGRVLTRSARALASHGLGSVAEAAALAVAGAGSRLLLARLTSASATCALAQSAQGTKRP